VQLENTGMSCVPADVAADQKAGAAAHRCGERAVLPCFLDFAPYDVPLSDDSSMRCRPIRRVPLARTAAACPAVALEGDSNSVLEPGEGVAGDRWQLGLDYFQFRGCSCLAGSTPQWSRGGTRLQCVPAAGIPAWGWVLVAVAAMLTVLGAAALALGSRWELMRSRWLREAELKRKRAEGMPAGGARLTVVVTDVEGYSGGGLGTGAKGLCRVWAIPREPRWLHEPGRPPGSASTIVLLPF
jgi:hypothetical protein